jgi:hypothetical protein
MASKFQLVKHTELGRGIDARSTDNAIEDGYAADITNGDPSSSGSLPKRKGYQGYGGYIPMRVAQVTKSGFQTVYKLKEGVSLFGVEKSPLIIQGRIQNTAPGDMKDTDQITYYHDFSFDSRDLIEEADGAVLSKTLSDHGFQSSDLFVDLLLSTSSTDNSNEFVYVDKVEVESAASSEPYKVNITYTSSSASSAFVAITNKEAVIGDTHVEDYVGAPLVPSGGAVSDTITAGTHQLDNFHVLPRFYEFDAGTTFEQIEPDLFTVDEVSGEVNFTLSSATNFDGKLILAAAPIANEATFAIAGTGGGAAVTDTFEITGLTDEFPRVTVYERVGTTLTLVIPDAVRYNAADDKIEIDYTNLSPTGKAIVVYYEFATLVANQVKVVDSLGATAAFSPTVQTDPQVTIWGIPHTGRYSTTDGLRGGHVLEIDAYKREAENRLFTGLAGNFHTEQSQSEVGSSFLLPSTSVNASSRISSATSRFVAPLIVDSTDVTSTRSRGLLKGDGVTSSGAVVTAAAFASPNFIDYTISLPSKTGTIVLSDANTPAGSDAHVYTSDFLTVSGMGHDAHNGTFQVETVTDGASSVTVRVAHPTIADDCFNESGSVGRGNVFSDRIVTDANTNFVTGDIITSSVIPSGVTAVVKSTDDTNVTVDGITQSIELIATIKLFATRTATAVPMKDTLNAASVDNLVLGDMLSVSGLEREVRVVHLHPYQDMSASITVAAGVATAAIGTELSVASNTATNLVFGAAHGLETDDPVVFSSTETLPDNFDNSATYFVRKISSTEIQLTPEPGSGVTLGFTGGTGTLLIRRVHRLVVGQRFFIADTGDPLLDGEQIVTSVVDLCSVTYATTSITASATGVMVGYVVELDEELTYNDEADDSTTFAVARRWIPAEAPTNAGDIPKSTYTDYFRELQDTMRSTIVGGNLYLTNGQDEVLKFDGTNVYQAGLFRWQPHLFVQVDTSVTSITTLAVSAAVSTAAGNKFTVGTGEAIQFTAGDVISHSDDEVAYTVQSVDTTNDLVYTTSTISGGSTGTIDLVTQYRYYFRLNAIDANNNIIASAVTGDQDFIVNLTSPGQIRMRLVGMPVWGNFDYDRLEVSVFRTQANKDTFFLIQNTLMSFSTGDGYIDIFDGIDDAFLDEAGSFDDVTVALKGAELGTTWNLPPRAKYMTSADNRLILANLRGYPKVDLVLRRNPEIASTSAADVDTSSIYLRRDAADTTSLTPGGSTTNMLDRAVYTFQTDAGANLSNIISRTTSFDFIDGDVSVASDVITEIAHGMYTGDRVQLSTTGVLPSPLAAATDYWVIRFNNNGIQLATSAANAHAGTFIDITSAAGGGTHTVTPLMNIDTTATSFTVYADASGFSLAEKSWVYLYHSAEGEDNDLAFAGWYQVASVTAGSFTVNFNNTVTVGTDVTHVDRWIRGTGTEIPILVGTDGNFNQNFGNTTGSYEDVAMQRFAAAVNATMRMTDTTLTGQATFVPWITAGAGSNFAYGQAILKQPKNTGFIPSIEIGSGVTDANYYINDVIAAAVTPVSATTILAPSRVVISYQNFPELFDNTETIFQEDSDSVVDINSADGQEITGVMPFFGSAAFGAGQVEGLVIVFKTNSIYLLDVNTRRIQKIESQSLGCTAPLSIGLTKNGINFVNESGVYRLNRNLGIDYVGKFVERIWRDTVNRDQLQFATGHHFGIGRQYKLSVPVGSSRDNSLVLVYDHTREGADQEFGAWTKYDNHPSTGWVNLSDDAFFATTDGQVFKVRNANDATDFRDDAAAISFNVKLKPMDGGMSAQRKIVGGIVTHFKMEKSSMNGTELLTSADFNNTFQSAGTFTITLGNKAVQTVKSAVPIRRLTFLQLNYTNSAKDENVILAGVDLLMAMLSEHGIQEKAEVS